MCVPLSSSIGRVSGARLEGCGFESRLSGFWKGNDMFGVYCNADTTEGRGPMVLEVVVPDMAEAHKIANALEPYGHAGQFTEVKDLDAITYESYKDWKENNDAAVKAKALAKLTAKERRVLGLL